MRKALQFSVRTQLVSSFSPHSLSLIFLSGVGIGHCVCVCAARVMLRVVDLVEHELSRDGRLGTVYLGGTTLKRRNHLLHHLIEEDVS